MVWYVLVCVLWCDVVLCYAMLCHAMLCYTLLCYAMLCYAMLCYAMLCYAMVWQGKESHGQRRQNTPLTISRSLLSARLAQITPMMYPPRIVDIKANTATFSARLPKLLKTESKSIGFGATRRSLPNDVK